MQVLFLKVVAFTKPIIVVKAINPELRRSRIQKNLPPRVIVNPRVTVNPRVIVNPVPARVRGSRPLESRWIVFLVFVCCCGFGNQVFSQNQQIEPIPPLFFTEKVSSKTPPRPVLPPKAVVPLKKKEIKTTVPDRLPDNISRLLKNRAGYKAVNSQSGQFMVYGPISPKRRGGILDVNRDTILIGPDHVAIAADRLRAAMLKRLGIPLFFGGKVKIWLNPTLNPMTTVPVVTVRHLSGYSYELTLPCEIEASKLVRALVQITLLDLANRKPQLRDTEMPFWLTVGLTQILLSKPDLVLVLKKPESNGREMVAEEVIRTVSRHDMLFKVRSRLSSRRAFDFSEVAMPSPAHIRGENWKDFQACSHLLVDRLLALPMGE